MYVVMSRDVSVIYGSIKEVECNVWIFWDGKFKVWLDGWLMIDEDNFLVIGDICNFWVGVVMF